PEVMSHSSFFYTPRCRPCSTLFPTRRSSDLAGHADVDRATLIGDELFRATDFDGNTAHGIDEVAGGFAQNAHLFALHVGRSANGDRKSTRLNSSHVKTSYAVFCLKKKKEVSA